MNRARRKFVLLLAEGPSDIAALYKPLKALFRDVDPSLVLMPLFPQNNRSHDLTSEPIESPEKLEGLISNVFIHDFLEQNSLLPKDIVRVIHIVDLDGAFIPKANVCWREGEIYYDDSVIYTSDVEGIRRRNQTKRINLEYLSKQSRLSVFSKRGKQDMREKSYSVYYFSCNLDHFLHGSANMAPEEKVPRAREFSNACEADPGYFVEVFTKRDEEIRGMTYSESWEYIKEGLNSLRPHSNLGVLVNELLREKQRKGKE